LFNLIKNKSSSIVKSKSKIKD